MQKRKTDEQSMNAKMPVICEKKRTFCYGLCENYQLKIKYDSIRIKKKIHFFVDYFK